MSNLIAIVKTVIDRVTVSSPGGPVRLVREGDRIYQGEELVTGIAGMAILEVGKGRFVKLCCDSHWNGSDLSATSYMALHDLPDSKSLFETITARFDFTNRPPITPHTAYNSDAAAPALASAGACCPGGLDNAADPAVLETERFPEDSQARGPDVSTGEIGDGSLRVITQQDSSIEGEFNAFTPDGTPRAYRVSQGPGNGQLAITSDGAWLYIPKPSYSGSDCFTLAFSDDHGGSGALIVLIDILTADEMPHTQSIFSVAPNAMLSASLQATQDIVVDDQEYDIIYRFNDGREGTTLTGKIVAGGIGRTSLYSLEDSPEHGMLTLNSDGTFCYLPVANYSGIDRFSVRISGVGIRTGISIVTLDITPAADLSARHGSSTFELEPGAVLIGVSQVLDYRNDQPTRVTKGFFMPVPRRTHNIDLGPLTV